MMKFSNSDRLMYGQHKAARSPWGVMSLNSHRLGSVLLTLAFALFTLTGYSQNAVSGKVTDSKGSGLPGVAITIKGSTTGTNTDVDGNFQVNVAPNATLSFSSIGFEPQDVPVGNKSVINVTLSEDVRALEEVVVVGYGTVRKKDATGAVSALGSKDFQKGIVTSPEQLMQGRVAGVQITQSSGEPGGGINVRIRGTSSVLGGNNPLFVIDGVPLSGDNTSSGGDNQGVGRQPAKNPLNFLNPDDIASIDILKDASATAIYGSRGANGVVLITTKRGKGKGSLDYGYSLGISNITKKYDLLNAQEYVAAGGQDQGAETDWQKELFRTAMTHQHNLSYGGGDNSGNYRFSLGYLSQDGIVQTSNVKRYSVGFSGTKKFINNKLTIGSNLNFANTLDTGVPISENIGFEGDLLGSILKANPTRSVYNAGGGFNQVTTTEPNPMAFVKLSRDKNSTLRALGNINAEMEIFTGLKFKTVLGFDKSMSSRKQAYGRDLLVTGITNIGRVYIRDVEANNQLWENYFTYDKEFGKVTLNALLGYSYQSFENSSKNIQAANFRTDNLDLMINNLGIAGTVGIKDATALSSVGSVVQNSSYVKDELQSYFGRVNLGFGNKYLFTGTLRVDGSSKFGGNNKYGYFPSGAFKWKLVEEKFIPKTVFTDLSLRVGYGVTGNQAIPHNVYDRRDRYSDYVINQNGDGITGGGLNAVAFNNPDLKWESTAAFNLGIDFSILKGRLSGSIDAYNKSTKDLLFKVVAAQPAPNPFVYRNLDTDIQNRGIELALNGVVVEGTKFSWEVLVNASYNKNLVKNLIGTYDTGEINGQGLSGAFAQRLAEGQPLFAYFLREFGGFDDNGNSIYPNGDFQQFLGGKSPLPKVNAGLTNNLKYGNFDLSIFFNGVFGNYLYSNTANAFFTQGSFANGRNVTKNVIGNGEGALNAPDVSTRFLEKGNFIRMQNFSLGYRIPMKSSKVLSNARVFVSGQNLFTITKYSGQDPEVSTNKSLNDIPSFGIDYTAYPRSRTWTIGANFSF
ncbi:iron complex outermembrane recepter protein [Dyadobacter koreensis]|uniref:Iron complex outermembrane recepter protein n=1 Tax=Dyadobacter koreensis TaxID=408657 RepID=A0A1H6R952_9BACT|nr:TonB-dependent receptor [Dyadobacter koreensis]SEI52349.1 iron complex outermembrane recepter protein [Dyadobacter koreensis]